MPGQFLTSMQRDSARQLRRRGALPPPKLTETIAAGMAELQPPEVTPVRVHRSRAKGSRLVSPNGLPMVCVTRGTKWGNPFRVFGKNEYLYCDASHRRTVLTPWVIFDHDQDIRNQPACAAMAVEFFRRWLTGMYNADGIVRPCTFTTNDIITELRGKNLACWCEPGDPCHADVLLELANGKRCTCGGDADKDCAFHGPALATLAETDQAELLKRRATR